MYSAAATSPVQKPGSPEETQEKITQLQRETAEYDEACENYSKKVEEAAA